MGISKKACFAISSAAIILLVVGGAYVSGWPGRAFSGGLKEVEGGYYYIFDDRIIAPNPRNEGSIIIPYSVVDYDGGDGYIVAARKKSTNSPEDPDFWILNTVAHELHGPLKKEDYETMRANLEVPSHVRLRKY